MTTINFYLNKKINKNGIDSLILRIICDKKIIPHATGIKVIPSDFDTKKQMVVDTDKKYLEKNAKIKFLRTQMEEYLNNSVHKTFTVSEIKKKVNELVKSYVHSDKIQIVKEQLSLYGKTFNFIDLFAGAGGFSEGFLQAEYNKKVFDFILASDINDNCELTHLVRYNHQLGLDASFLRQDITEPDFLDNLLKQIGDKQIDVVCGGPPCQSFSLAGKRKKFDKKDDLFSHYLEVIKVFQPKYFIMENVKGILTKEGGKIQKLILNEIRSIIDVKEIPNLIKFIRGIKTNDLSTISILSSINNRIRFENKSEKELVKAKQEYINELENKFRKLTPKITDYKTSKTDININTIRHGLRLLSRNKALEIIQRQIIKEKDLSYIDNDYFAESFNFFLDF